MASSDCFLIKLPAELFEQVFFYLPVFSICQLESTCKTVKESIEKSRVWRLKAEECRMVFNYSFVNAMLDHAREREFQDASVFKVIIASSKIVHGIIAKVEKFNFGGKYWKFRTESLMEIFRLIRRAQMEAWSKEFLAVDDYKRVNYESLMEDIFKDGVVNINETVMFLRDEEDARMFTSLDPIVMGDYVKCFFMCNKSMNHEKISGYRGWLERWEVGRLSILEGSCPSSLSALSLIRRSLS